MERDTPSPEPTGSTRCTLSVVVPAYNECQNLTPLYERLRAALEPVDLDWELIFVDDGSADDSRDVLEALHGQDNRVKAIFLSRNFGQSQALTAGIQVAQGDAVVIMDADGQDPPEVIPAMVAMWREGYEIVGGHRTRRANDPPARRAAAYLFYRVMNAMVGWDLPFDTGEFRLVDRAVAEVFRQCPQRHRLVRTLTSWSGFRQTTVDYEHAPRLSGRSKYTWRANARLAITSVTSFSLMPLRAAMLLGMLAAGIGGVATVALLLRLASGADVSWVSISLAGLWTFGGIQCMFIGIVGEYVGRTYMETQHRPIYVVRGTMGLDRVGSVRPVGAPGNVDEQPREQ